MSLANAHTTLMMPEALVIESLARGARHSFHGCGQGPHRSSTALPILYGGVSFLVSEEDLADAQLLIAQRESRPSIQLD